MAGLGAAINTGNVTRGNSVAVIGCGGVGMAAIAGSALAGASTIIAVDIDDTKLGWARDMGATHTVNSKETDPVEAIQALTGGHGADVVIDAVGRPETWKQAFYARDLAGTVVLVGVPTPDMKIPDIPLIDVFGRGGALKSSWYGDCLPSRDFPMLVDLYRQGRLDLDAFVTEEIAIDDVEAAFDKMHGGARAALGGDVLWAPAGGPRGRVRHVLPRRGGARGRQQHLGRRRRRGVRRHRRAPRRRRHPRRGRPDGRSRRSCCTHAHDDHCRVAPALRERTSAPILLHPDDRPLWELTHTDELWDVDLDRRPVDQGRRGLAQGAPHARARARRGLRLRPRPRLRLHRRHPLPGRAGRHRAVVQRRRPHRGLDPRASCSGCPTRRSCTPGTATTPRSAPSGRSSAEATETRTARRSGRASRLKTAGMLRRAVPLLLALGLPPRRAAATRRRRARRPAPGADGRGHDPADPGEPLGLVEGWGPTRAELDRAARMVGRMRLPDLAGQVIVAQWRGTAAPVQMVRELHLGGVIAFSDNVASTGQVRSVNATLDRAVRRPWPLFLAVDQEGGIVERVKGDATRFPTFMCAGAARDPQVTDGGRPRQRRRAARARLRRRLRAGRRRHRPGRATPPSARARPARTRGGRRARRRRGRRDPAGRRWCRCSSTSPGTARCRRTATSRCRCRRAPASSSPPSTSRPSRPPWRPGCPP